MSAKLSTITTQYRRFTKNQVLTEGNLNEVVDFFDDQDRLSRIYLSGVGIVCGFYPAYDESQKIISLTQGTGITTDGDLFKLYQADPFGNKKINFESKTYTHCKIYDNTKAAYKPFFYDESNKQLPLFELLTEEQQKKEKDPYFALNQFSANTQFDIKDAVLLLYLETYEKESDLCVSLSCDNQGLEIVGNYKVLIVSKTVAIQIMNHDSMTGKINYTNLYHQLPDVKSNRIVLKSEDFIHLEAIKKAFCKGIFKNNVVKNLLEGYNTLLTGLNKPLALDAIQKKINELFNFESDPVLPPDFQYLYDLLNDLVDTYNETKGLLLAIDDNYCDPDIDAFPKHLMLGELIKTAPCSEFRHAFYKSPLLTGENGSNCNDCFADDKDLEEKEKEAADEIQICYGENTARQKMYSLILRTLYILENYNPLHDFIKITPSLQMGKLGKKAIPFYNDVNDSLIRAWDFDKTILGLQKNNVSYHDDLLNTKKPLEIHLDSDFYRIEGHQGRNYKEALKAIQQIRLENGLGFNIMVLAVNANELDKTIHNFTKYYLGKNHGYEHKAGVVPGGTFIMIYLEEKIPYYYYYNSRRPSLTGDFEKFTEGIPVLNPVVADFSIPYLCCDENNIGLTLPVDKICFDSKTPPIPFKVSPAGGFVKANVRPDQNGGVTVDESGVVVFDPNLVSQDLIGQAITFTVNNFETKCAITLFEKPLLDFIAVPVSSSGISETEVAFTIKGENLSGNKYTWNFGDKTDPVIVEKTEIKHIYKYNSEGQKKFTFDVTLSADNGNCGFQITNPVSFEISDSKVLVENKLVNRISFCRKDKAVLLTLEPAIKDAVLSGEGVQPAKGGQFQFIPLKVPEDVTSVTILVNGKPSNLVITLLDLPVPNFTASLDKAGILTLTNNSQNALSYTWKINEELIITDKKDPLERPTALFNESSILVSLTAEGKCGQATDGPRPIEIRKVAETNNCLYNADLFVKNSLKTISYFKEIAISNKFNTETNSFLSETENRFVEIQKNLEDYINGKLNDKLSELFTQEYFNLISKVAAAAIEEQNGNHITAVQGFIFLNTSLFYTILRCQNARTLKASEKQIVHSSSLFTNLFKSFLERKFNTDRTGSLKEFLSGMQTVFAKIDFILSGLNTQLEDITSGAKF
ncbi:PKD domain-containing protein [Flavobacterium fluviatile]|uniref:PKD domain-containing protein n=1 Tax=Flavobacterium fluviatile TaxID=1862387 RepID=UPI0013D32292|nr:PKD domain-containing protein [Flavobacterium fluviatile]